MDPLDDPALRKKFNEFYHDLPHWNMETSRFNPEIPQGQWWKQVEKFSTPRTDRTPSELLNNKECFNHYKMFDSYESLLEHLKEIHVEVEYDIDLENPEQELMDLVALRYGISKAEMEDLDYQELLEERREAERKEEEEKRQEEEEKRQAEEQAKRAQEAQVQAANPSKRQASCSVNQPSVTKKAKKPKRNFSTTKTQVIRRGHKNAEIDTLKQASKSSSEPTTSLLSAFRFADNYFSPGNEENRADPPSSFTNIPPRQHKHKANSRGLWAKLSVELKKWYLESFEIHEHADPCLKQPNALPSKYQCDCSSKKTSEIYCYMLHSHIRIKVEHCNHHSLVKKLMLMQMLPSSTAIPKVAIHFAVFDKLMSLKLNGYLSNYAFVKVQNSDNLVLSYYGQNGFKNLNNGLFNVLQVIYRNLKNHALDDLQLFQEPLYCHACVGADRVGVVLDGNFQLKRKKNQKNVNDKHCHPSIFSQSRNLQHLWENEGEVEKFSNEEDDFKDEMCGLEELDNNGPSFKATAANRKVSTRFDEEGVFSMNCARHGVPIRLYDIYNGEGRKYALAAVSHIMSILNDKQQLLIMYDIVCLCKNKFEACIPNLKDKDPIYLVTVFHAYAHSMNCQVVFHPKVVNGSGNTDGEGVERFWGTANKFISMIRQMSKFNRKALLSDVVHCFKQNKMLELPGQISSKFSKALAKVAELNISNKEYLALEEQWIAHVDIVMIPASPAGVQTIVDRAERTTATARDSYYLTLNIDLLTLDDMKDAKIEITNGKQLQKRRFLISQIDQMREKYGYERISSFDDRQFLEHRARIVDIRYCAMNDFIKHLLFAILMKEHRISQPGSFGNACIRNPFVKLDADKFILGTAKTARIIMSLDTLKKKTEVVIKLINDFVDKSYTTEEEKKRRKKETVGKEVEMIRKYAAENGLDLPTPLNNWHILKRNVEEIVILIGEANRVIQNYERELQSLIQKASTHFVKLRILDVTRRLRTAKAFLSGVAMATPPVLSPSRAIGDSDKMVVIFPEERFVDNAPTVVQALANDEVVEADNDGIDDVDLAEGGESNPEEEILITFSDLIQDE
ncbi:hypothetical protein MBANPS3_010080 [Mucor bainieri]